MQRLIAVVVTVPSGRVISSVPQKANAVRVEPVLLLMPNVKLRVSVVPAVQELHASPPVSAALTNERSPEVQLDSGGKVVVVWDMADKANKMKKGANDIFAIRIRRIFFAQLLFFMIFSFKTIVC